MDRKGWIIIILCTIGIIFSLQTDKGNKKKLEAQNKENSGTTDDVDKTDSAKDSSDGTEVGKTDEATKAPVKNDDPYEIVATTDDVEVIKYTFSNFGGGIKTAEMLQEKNVFNGGNITLNKKGKTVIGALATSYKDIESVYYERVEQTKSSVTYRGELEDGVTVTKAWTLENGTEDKAPKFKLTISFKTKEGKTLDLSKYSITTGTAAPVFNKEQMNLAGWFYYEDGDYNNKDKGNFTAGFLWGDAKPVDVITTENLEYFGVNSQFFGTAIFPQSDAMSDTLWAAGKEVTMNDGENTGKRWIFQLGMELPDKTVSHEIPYQVNYEVFVGAKKNKQMGSISENSDDIMNFSMFSSFAWISSMMNNSLNGIHNWFPEGAAWSWGLAIVLLTIFIRIIIWPLHNKSTRTMKRMSKLQPIMKELREKHKDNPQKLNQETMKLYREYGVNPMGGCLPMLVQIPIFFGVFNMINAAVELRGQPFMWVADLSQPDHLTDIAGLPINLLPILMAVTMVIQMRMTPQTGDKLQRRIFMLMPLVFFIFCYNYASALALYWTTQNIVSIGQTWLTQRMPEPELSKRSGKGGQTVEVVDDGKPRKKGFMERMAEKLEEAQNQRDAAAGKAPPAKKRAMGQQTEKKPKKRTPKTGG